MRINAVSAAIDCLLLVQWASTVCDGCGRCIDDKNRTNHGLPWRRSAPVRMPLCVEVAGEGEHIYLRDGKMPDDGVLCFTRAEWEAFLTGVKAGDFDSV